MNRFLILSAIVILGGLFNTSCATDPSYQQVSYGGSLFYFDTYGRYYRWYDNGYHPCPKPPGKPDRPPKPVPPIARPPGNKPDRPVTLPVETRPPSRPVTRPSAPSVRPTPMPRPMPMARPMPAARGR